MYLAVDYEHHGLRCPMGIGVWVGSRIAAALCWDMSLCVYFMCSGFSLCHGLMALRFVVTSVELARQFSHLILFPSLGIFELLRVWCMNCTVCGLRWYWYGMSIEQLVLGEMRLLDRNERYQI